MALKAIDDLENESKHKKEPTQQVHASGKFFEVDQRGNGPSWTVSGPETLFTWQ